MRGDSVSGRHNSESWRHKCRSLCRGGLGTEGPLDRATCCQSNPSESLERPVPLCPLYRGASAAAEQGWAWMLGRGSRPDWPAPSLWLTPAPSSGQFHNEGAGPSQVLPAEGPRRSPEGRRGPQLSPGRLMTYSRRKGFQGASKEAKRLVGRANSRAGPTQGRGSTVPG